MSQLLAASDFPLFFEAVHGYPPFAWQAALAERVLTVGWPEAIDVPTGMGKTAVLDVAVFSLAAEASWLPSTERRAPTRTVFVVDRRVIVDQAFARAKALARVLVEAAGGVVGAVSDALRQLSGGAGPPLEAVRMRGGVTWGWRWLRSPDQPAVVVGTVDQVGSRLLFRGYGVGSRLRPIDAALCGTDSLLVLDEAHLSRALVETAVTVHRYESAAERPVLPARRPRPVVMSATLPPTETDVLQLDSSTESSPAARDRLEAAKLVAPVELQSSARDPLPDLARALAEVSADRLGDDGVDRVAVVCNTVPLARAVHRLLQGKVDADVPLLIGRCREFDRERLAYRWGAELAAVAVRPVRDRPILAVATQTIEVGADFDLDVLVTEAAPLDALVQRLGRLNRLGRRREAHAVVVHSKRRHSEDPVYGPATDRTWDWLAGVTGPPAQARPTDIAAVSRATRSVDLGPLSIRSLATPEDRAHLAPEPPLVPVPLGPTLAAWARTEPSPMPDQPVAPFLHGIERGVPQVQVCWRAGLPARSELGALEVWQAELDSASVLASETVEVPVWEAARFLSGEPPGQVSDLEGVGTGDDFDFDEAEPPDAALFHADGRLEWAGSRRVRPGDTVVVRAEVGGHDEWGWTGERGAPVPDVADLCHRAPRLRLRPGVLVNGLGGGPGVWWSGAGVSLGVEEDGSPAALAERLVAAVVAFTPGPEAPTAGDDVLALARTLAGLPFLNAQLGRGAASVKEVGPDGRQWLVVTGPRLGTRPAVEDQSDEGEITSSMALRPVSLERHLIDVGDRAASVAARLGLPPGLVAAVELAGRCHDLGKADRRFQVMLHGGDRLRAEAIGEPLAKSGMDPGDRRAFGVARRAAGWPAGMRHEALSSELVQHLFTAFPGAVDDADRQLVAHLVASHHGYARPLLPPVPDPGQGTVEAMLPRVGAVIADGHDRHLVDWEAPSRFERLNRRYGWWGLALLEAIVRLADIAVSEDYSREGN